MAKASGSKVSGSRPSQRERRPKRSLSPSSGSDSEGDAQHDQRSEGLAQLQDFGNAFLESFGIDGTHEASSPSPSAALTSEPCSSSTRKINTRAKGKGKAKADESQEAEPAQRNEIDRVFDGSNPEEAWEGIADSDDGSSVGSIHQEQEWDGFDGHSGVSDMEGPDDDGQRSALPSPAPPIKAAKGKGKERVPAEASKATAPRSRSVQTVVFGADSGSASSPDFDAATAKKGWKAFMSSKISKISQDSPDTAAGTSKPRQSKAEMDEEKQLESNDRLLSHLLSTTLFAPGAEREGKKRNLSSNDTLARIIELSATESQRKGAAVGRGWGETELQRRQLAKMPSKIRQDIRRSNADKRDKERDRAKELGTWRPSLKANYSNKATATEMGVKAEPKKRLRGIGAGIGKFKDGTLTLSKSDVRKIVGPSSSGGDRGDKNKRRKK